MRPMSSGSVAALEIQSFADDEGGGEGIGEETHYASLPMGSKARVSLRYFCVWVGPISVYTWELQGYRLNTTEISGALGQMSTEYMGEGGSQELLCNSQGLGPWLGANIRARHAKTILVGFRFWP
jgi:hypothetical protein